MRRWLVIGLFLLFICIFTDVNAEDYTAILAVKNGTAEIKSVHIDGESWLFLPSFADLSTLNIREISGEYTLESIEEEEGVWLLETAQDELYVMQSQNLRALFLFSDDPEEQGREYIESSTSHSAYATGSIALVNKNGIVDYAGKLSQIRGRGNTTWGFEKNPYQIKLAYKADLLKTGIPSEKNRTWVLLADVLDGTQLQNRISLDLAKEMGLSDNSRCEHVDLYYDGEYRGLYLLTEKSEIGEGRVEETDYEKLIKKWNKRIGQPDLSILPLVIDQNSNGDKICYTDGVFDGSKVDAGAYFLEMFSRVDDLWESGFVLDGNRAFRIKNPRYASKDMVCYVSELLGDGLLALQNGGIHPETFESAEKWFDFDSFARVVLLYELAHNVDAFILASTYFVLPAGETQFIAGPVWDFDRAMRNPEYRTEAGYTWGLKKDSYSNWITEFYGVPAFMEAAQKVYEETLYPLVTQILLGSERGRYLRPLDEYVQEIRMSKLMNNRLYPEQHKDYRFHYADSFDAETTYLKNYLQQQNEWLYQAIVHNGESDADHINITMKAEWTYAEEPLEFDVFPWSQVTVQSCTHWQLTEATEEEYARWGVELILSPKEGFCFEHPQVWINNGRFEGEIQPDGTLKVVFQFEDLSYRPVDYYGDDIGLIYNPDFYAFNYPELAAEYEDDPEGLLDYFCYDGMAEGHVGNGFFDPQNMIFYNPELKNIIGEDWSLYYWDFLYYGYEIEGWMKNTDMRFVPPVLPLEQ